MVEVGSYFLFYVICLLTTTPITITYGDVILNMPLGTRWMSWCDLCDIQYVKTLIHDAYVVPGFILVGSKWNCQSDTRVCDPMWKPNQGDCLNSLLDVILCGPEIMSSKPWKASCISSGMLEEYTWALFCTSAIISAINYPIYITCSNEHSVTSWLDWHYKIKNNLSVLSVAF